MSGVGKREREEMGNVAEEERNVDERIARAQGYFQLGKSRSEGRLGQISVNRLPTGLRATTRVRKVDGKFCIVRGASSSFETDDGDEEKIEDEQKTDDGTGLRRRRRATDSNKSIRSQNSDKNIRCEERRGQRFEDVDPIHYFGFYSPTALRAAQRHFRKALQDAIELANIKSGH